MANEDANVVISADVSQYQQSVSQATAQTNQFASSVDALASKLDGITKRAGKKLALFGAADLAAMTGMVAIAAKYDKQLSSLNANLATTTKNSKAYALSINQIARDMPVARAEVAALVTQLEKQAQASAQSAESMARSFIKLGAATSENSSMLAASMIQLNKQMNTMASGSGAVAGFSNSLVAVSKAAGVSSQGVLDFAQNLAPFTRTAGIGEKALLGISSAFNAAGADGYAAANTFNSMVSDITRSIQNGSPDITKYSNLIGVTVSQFKEMDATDRITRIFETIAKQGPNAIRTLDMLSQDGIRASKAIQAVTQSGDMRGMINKAVAGYDNSDPLNQSAKAGQKGLTDSLDQTRENIMQMGQAIGSGLVTPATQALDVFNKILSTTNAIAAPILAIGGVLSTVLGGAALGGGAIGSTLGTFGQIAMAGYALRSRPARALLGGLQAGFQSRNATPLTGLAANQARLYAAGEMPRYASPFYTGARGFGQAIAGPMQSGPNYLGRALTAPIRLVGWGAMASANFYDDSRTNGEDRPRAWQARALQNTAVQGADRSERNRIRALGRSLDQQVAAGAMTEAAAKRQMESAVRLARANVTAAATTDQLTATTRQAIGAMGKAAAANVRAGVSNLGAVGGMAARGLGGMIGGPMGLLAAGFGAYSVINGANNMRNAAVPDAAMNPISEYNAALGLSTDKLTDLNQAIAKTARSYSTADAALSDMAAAAKMAASSTSYTSSIAKNLSGSDTGQGLAFLRSIGGQLTGDNAASVNADLVRKYGAAGASQITQQYKAGKNVTSTDINYLLGAAQTADSKSLWSGFSDLTNGGISDESQLMAGNLVGSISSASAGAAAQDQFKGQQVQASLVGGALTSIVQQQGKGQLSNVVATKTISGLEQNFFGGEIGFNGRNDMGGGWAASAADYTGKDMADLTEADIQKWFVEKAIPDNPTLQKWYDQQKALGLDPFMAISKAYTVSRPSSDPVVQRINATKLGGFAKGDSATQYALNEGFGSGAAQQASVNQLLVAGMKAGGGDSSKTIMAFDQLISSIDLSSDRLSQLGQAAWAAYSGLRSLQRGGMSSAGASASVLMDATAIINAPTTNANAEVQGQKKQERAQELSATEQQYKQYAQALFQYQTQVTRSNDDFYRSQRRAQDAFGMQMMYAEQDYYRQREWNAADFGKSMKRAAEDAAKSIYNPWERVYSQLTAGAGDVAQNMEDQNKMIQDQVGNLRKAHEAGLSQQVIDQLDLANPANAQQFQAILDDIAQNPQYVERLNAAAKTRAAATTKLTQNSDNLQYRRALEDFNVSLTRSDTLFKQSQERANKQFGISMAQMAEDHTTAMDRAKEDMNNYGSAIANNFSEAEKYIKGVQDKLGIANKYTTDMAKLFADNPALRKMIMDGTYGITDTGDGTPTGQSPVTPRYGKPSSKAKPDSYTDPYGPMNRSSTPSQYTDSSRTDARVDRSTVTKDSNNRYIKYETNYKFDNPIIATNDPKDLSRALQQASRQSALTRGGKPLPIN